MIVIGQENIIFNPNLIIVTRARIISNRNTIILCYNTFVSLKNGFYRTITMIIISQKIIIFNNKPIIVIRSMIVSNHSKINLGDKSFGFSHTTLLKKTPNDFNHFKTTNIRVEMILSIRSWWSSFDQSSFTIITQSFYALMRSFLS
jgi:hypothetical protein